MAQSLATINYQTTIDYHPACNYKTISPLSTMTAGFIFVSTLPFSLDNYRIKIKQPYKAIKVYGL